MPSAVAGARRSFTAVVALTIGLLTPPGPIALAQNAPPAPKVTVAKPVVKPIMEWDDFTGRFEAVDSVDVRARVSGYLEKIHFEEGTLVKEGDPLFTIDRRPY